ncbi:hypothetical protein [Haloarcula nitratireducens]|uniref:Uncharacterized protein n=1 Tax=Haloarcula nitratireducens TaxID=2487749 RepID=A0AAW4P7R4_9EURY|nr:hypothetical protein [Halomicroarcula nitratireducens]MBX0293798.1 hypothetical protein [Halomicroarcula nitratireducens]
MSVVDRLKRPEYTGENRCLPCTAVNGVVAVGLALLAAVLGFRASGSTVATLAAAAVLLPAAAAIYLRGYLVPGTPTLTKRYMPASALALFGKGPAAEPSGTATTPEEDVDVERLLLDIGALEPCGDDLCLTEWYSEAWRDALDEADPDRTALLAQLNLDDTEVEFEDHGEAFRARVDEGYVGTWESRAAFEADVAAARVLEENYDGWERLSVRRRGQVLNGLRLFLDTCPACGGTPTFGTETVQSCCSEYDVAAVACGNCDARLFESEPV